MVQVLAPRKIMCNTRRDCTVPRSSATSNRSFSKRIAILLLVSIALPVHFAIELKARVECLPASPLGLTAFREAIRGSVGQHAPFNEPLSRDVICKSIWSSSSGLMLRGSVLRHHWQVSDGVFGGRVTGALRAACSRASKSAESIPGDIPLDTLSDTPILRDTPSDTPWNTRARRA